MGEIALRHFGALVVIGQLVVDDQTERNGACALECLLDGRARNQWNTFVVVTLKSASGM
jgi:hypothetical protein